MWVPSVFSTFHWKPKGHFDSGEHNPSDWLPPISGWVKPPMTSPPGAGFRLTFIAVGGLGNASTRRTMNASCIDAKLLFPSCGRPKKQWESAQLLCFQCFHGIM
ncbi:unnamed protein product [Menidia menidia]|uniref:(Atlantic silverside) hypothetical protein n=1 Tax=Menidia menidia TaxID=238744 RepID=A0A8S4B1U7_9TELE|nr:unnamed protein product [Menidia menidia]